MYGISERHCCFSGIRRHCSLTSRGVKQTRPARPAPSLPGLDDVEQECWQGFLDCSMRLLATLNGCLVYAHQLTLFDVLLLDFLANSDNGAARKSELADALMLAPNRVAQQIRRLEAQGLVSRNPTRYDRRGVLASITPGGRTRAAAAMKTYAQEIRTLYLIHLTRQQMVDMSDGYCRVSTSLKDSQPSAKFKRL
jgi:DNA-binding MarR family transcriptional regulator